MTKRSEGELLANRELRVDDSVGLELKLPLNQWLRKQLASKKMRKYESMSDHKSSRNPIVKVISSRIIICKQQIRDL